MNVVIYGATGMVGQGVLRACLADPAVDRVLVVGRSATGQVHPKLRERVRPDVADETGAADELAGYDACFFCLGVSSLGMDEARYTATTFDLTLRVAQTLSRLNPAMTFLYVSGVGTDGSERGPVMWARVKGRTENALARLPFKAAIAVRPGVIQPLHGIRSKTKSLNVIYALIGPALSLARRALPRLILTTDSVAQAMIAAALLGAPKPVLEPADLFALSRARAAAGRGRTP